MEEVQILGTCKIQGMDNLPSRLEVWVGIGWGGDNRVGSGGVKDAIDTTSVGLRSLASTRGSASVGRGLGFVAGTAFTTIAATLVTKPYLHDFNISTAIKMSM